jgi:hypothetical protein
MKLRRGLAVVLLAALSLALFAPLMLAHEHDPLCCTHHACTVCFAIRAGSALLRFISIALLGFVLLPMPVMCATAGVQPTAHIGEHITPVSLKVKMTN